MSKTTFQIVASEFASAFTRENPRNVWCLKDDAPDWMRDAIRDAHSDGRLPDDRIYENCRSMVDSISEIDDPDNVDTVEIADGCVDIYTVALTQRLAQSNLNVSACDEAVSEGLCEPDADMCKRMQMGQHILLDRACAALVSAIRTQADERAQQTADEVA
jgi:hypothetical protein